MSPWRTAHTAPWARWTRAASRIDEIADDEGTTLVIIGLRNCGLVQAERAGRFITYGRCRTGVEELLRAADALVARAGPEIGACPTTEARRPMLHTFLLTVLAYVREIAEMVVLGFVVAGVINAVINKDDVARYLGGNLVRTNLLGATLGVVTPLCCCSAIPTAMALYRAGSRRGLACAFLTATPWFNWYSLAALVIFLGPRVALAIAGSAVLIGFAAGVLIDLISPRLSDLVETVAAGLMLDASSTAVTPRRCQCWQERLPRHAAQRPADRRAPPGHRRPFVATCMLAPTPESDPGPWTRLRAR